jgi:hypothetical protein
MATMQGEVDKRGDSDNAVKAAKSLGRAAAGAPSHGPARAWSCRAPWPPGCYDHQQLVTLKG